MTSLMTPQYHYMVHRQLGEELYDWIQDAAETVNLAKTPAGQAVAVDLAAQIKTRMALAPSRLGVPRTSISPGDAHSPILADGQASAAPPFALFKGWGITVARSDVSSVTLSNTSNC